MVGLRPCRSREETMMTWMKGGVVARCGPAVAAAVVLGLALVADGGRLPAVADGYTFQTIDGPAADAVPQLVWINNAGLIVVQYQQPPDSDFGKNQHAGILQNGAW